MADVMGYPEALAAALAALRDLVDASVADSRAATFAEASVAIQMLEEAQAFDEAHSDEG